MFGAKAHVIFYPFILFKYPKDTITDELFRHELQHVYQIKSLGYFKFFYRYIKYSIKYGYKQNPYEIDARTASLEPLDENEEFLRTHG